MDSLHHLLILCCYGGQPFINFHSNIQHQGTHQIDPTDWVATDTAGSLLDNSSLSSIPHLSDVLRVGTPLSSCDLYNISFSTTADQQLFDRYQANLACRCPSGFYGSSCELLPPLALPLSSQRPLPSRSMVIIFAAVLLALFIIVFMMVRGCFCDCFGPIMRLGGTSSNSYDKPLDPEDVKKCLQKYRAHEARQEMVQEQQHPLISTISNPCAAPYNTSVLPSAPPPNNPNYRVPSPPPSYSSLAGSIDRLPASNARL